MEKQAFFSLDKETSLLLKGWAILLVLLGHTDYILWGGAGGVALFLLLSGYGICTSYEDHGLDGYWRKRIRKVWLPYVLVGAFDVIALRVDRPDRILCTLVGLDLDRIADGTMWYISFILLWYLVFFAVAWPAKNMERRLRRIVVTLGMFAAVFLFQWLADLHFWAPERGADVYLLAFPLGVLLRYLRDVKVRPALKQLFWLALLFLSAAYLFRIYGCMYSTRMAFAMALPAISVTQTVKIGGPGKRALQFFGRISYPLYLFEGLFLGVRQEWFSVAQLSVLIDLMFFLVTIGAALVFDSAYKRLEKLLPGKD